MKLFKFNQRGHLHLVVPIIVVVIIAVIGGVTYKAVSKAASSVTGCVASTYQSGDKDSGSSHCVQYIQQMLNGDMAYFVYSVKGATTINAASSVEATASAFGNQNFGSTSDTYDSNTIQAIKIFQTWANTSDGAVSGLGTVNYGLSSSAFATAFRPNGALTVSGETDSKTWYMLCQAVNKMPSSDLAVTDSTDYVGGKTTGAKTNMWYIRSYMRTASTAASDANCAGLLSGSSTTTPPVAPTGVKASVSSTGNLVVSWAKVTGATKYYIAVLNGSTSISLPNHYVTGTSATIDKPTVLAGDSSGKGDVEVRSCNANATDACGGWSSKVAFSLGSSTTPPVAPTGVKASTTSGNLVISWGKVTGATKYTVAVLNSAKASISLPNNSVTVTSATIDKATVIKGDAAGTGYVEVRSCNANATDACGGWSTPQVAFSFSSAASTTTPPVAPTGVKASTTSGNLVISWGKVTGATKYTVAVLNSAKASISLPNNSVTVTSATIDKATVIKGDAAGTGYVEVRSCNANATDACGGWSTPQVAFSF